VALDLTIDAFAFFSYSHFDDEHDAADLSRLREKLELELRAQSGVAIRLFHDRRDIAWGEAWKRRVDDSIDVAAFLVPIVSPTFLRSPECRRELESFRQREQRIGRDDLILPIYYIQVPELETRAASADDPVIALLQSRQYADWRPLRHKSLTSIKGRQAVTELAGRFLAAVRRVQSLPVTPPSSSQARPGGPVVLAAPSHPGVGDTDDVLLRGLVDRDPLTAFAAAALVSNRPDLLLKVADLAAGSPVGAGAVRFVTSRHPQAAAEVLLPRIEAAGDDWGAASRVTSYFDAALAPYCEASLGEYATRGHIDRQRLATEALGYCGSPGWAFQLRELVNDTGSYDLGKLASYVLEALARFVVRSPAEGGPDRVRHAADSFREELVHLETAHPSAVGWLRLLTILLDCDGRHADAFIAWLDEPSRTVSRLGAELLGYLRIVRAAPPLARLLSSTTDTASRRYYAEALARIGTASSIDALLSSNTGEAREALTIAADKIEDSNLFARVADAAMLAPRSLSYLVVRGLGRRPAVPRRPWLMGAIDDHDALTRGCAVLALARRREIGIARVRIARDQAADEAEHVLSTLGLLVLDPAAYPQAEADLRVKLGKDSFAWMPELQFDVLEVLGATGRADAAALANAWQRFYRLATLQT
jgi:hypothetical protein